VIVPTLSGERTRRLLQSLAAAGSGGAGFQTLVVDNGSGDPALRRPQEWLEGAELIGLDSNLGYSRAVNLAARRAEGEALVLLNDDCLVEPGFVEGLTEALDPNGGVAMSAAVLRDATQPELIDTAGMELDSTLLVFDYLNGEPLRVLEGPVADPVGPSAAAAGFWRDAFLELGGFDENLFAYWEDVDLVLRLRRAGASCRLAARARGTHEHSATLGSGSARKNYLIGFGRGYVLRKWGVLSPGRLPAVLARDLALCAGQAVIDRNLAGLRGRVHGLRAGRRAYDYPADGVAGTGRSARSTLARRWRRRARLRAAR
jgi:N-acetylglucosaminyl-diphospho-decaprenol L-rhamnosyltransferase